MPKVSPPVSSSGPRQTGNVLDKIQVMIMMMMMMMMMIMMIMIQAELAETKRREEELRRQRRSMSRSQPDLSILETSAEAEEAGEADSGEEVRTHWA